MTERRWQATNHAGLVLPAFGCAAGPPGISLDDEGDTGGDGDTDEPTE